jgi:hypothetical protein
MPEFGVTFSDGHIELSSYIIKKLDDEARSRAGTELICHHPGEFEVLRQVYFSHLHEHKLAETKQFFGIEDSTEI